MAAVKSFCSHHMVGHCKFGATCRYEHVRETCMENNCDLEGCHKRHPRECLFYRTFRKYKFGSFCSYKHTEYDAIEYQMKQKVDEITSKLETLLRTYETDKKYTTECMEKLTEQMDELLTQNSDASTFDGVDQNGDKEIHKIEDTVEGIISDLQSLCAAVDALETKVSKIEAFASVSSHKTTPKMQKLDPFVCTPPPTLIKRTLP